MAVIVAGTLGLFVRLKLAAVATPVTDAVAVKAPPVELAVNAGAVATPLAFVVTTTEPPKVPLAPLPGTANVTCALGTRLLFASFTVAWSSVGNAVFTAVFCGVPAVAVMLAGRPGLLVRLKLAGVLTPLVDAVTV